MGKRTKTKTTFTNGAVKIDGKTKAKTYKKGNTVYTNYNMSPEEKQAYQYAEKSFSEGLPSINVFEKETQEALKRKIGTYKEKGMDTITSVYDPMIDNLKNDIASRFGNYDNSSFLKNLNSIEDSRAKAVSSLAQDLITKENELIDNELDRRYKSLSFLNGVTTQTMDNISKMGTLSAGNSYKTTTSSSNNIGNYVQMGVQLLKTFYGY